MAILLVLGLVKFLHDLFTATWIGGLFTLAIVVLPSIKKTMGMNPESKKLIMTIRKRLNGIVWISIIGLLVTGILLSNSSPLFGGLFSIANEYSILLTIKHIVIALMVIIVIVRGHVLPRMTNTPPQKIEKISKVLMMLNLVFGIVVLLLSGFTAAAGIIETVTP
ncbi:MAG: CopD family protein [Candidatus Thorarchaeota archaeon]